MKVARQVLRLSVLAVVLAGMASAQVAEQRGPFVEAQPRYEGPLQTRIAGKQATVRVDYRIWSIGPGVRLEGLPLAPGDVVYELHSGKLTTRSGDRAVERKPGSFWLVPAGEAQSLETHDDSVVLRTIAVARP